MQQVLKLVGRKFIDLSMEKRMTENRSTSIVSLGTEGVPDNEKS